MARDWNFEIVQPSGSFAAVAFVDPSAVKVTEPMNDSARIEGKLLTVDPSAALLTVASIGLRVYVDGVCRFFGRSIPTLDIDDVNASFIAADPWWWLAQRLIQPNGDGTPLAFTDTAAADVMWALIAQQEARSPTGLMQGQMVGAAQMTATYQQGQAVSEAIQQIAQMSNGPFFRVDPVDDPVAHPGVMGSLSATPTPGAVREAAVFGHGEDTVDNLTTGVKVSYGMPVTGVYATGGTDEAGNQLTSHQTCTQDVIDRVGLIEIPVSFTDVTDQAHLDELAAAQLLPDPPKTFTVATLPTNGRAAVPLMWDDFDRGDTVPLTLDHGALKFDGYVRVNAIDISLSDDDGEETYSNLVLEEVQL